MEDLKNFISLNVEEKFKYIEENGIFLMDRNSGNKKFFLYYLAKVFCEVSILELLDHNDQIVSDIQLFKQSQFLEPYLKNIKIAELY